MATGSSSSRPSSTRRCRRSSSASPCSCLREKPHMPRPLILFIHITAAMGVFAAHIRTVYLDTDSRFSPFSFLQGHSRCHSERSARRRAERRTCFLACASDLGRQGAVFMKERAGGSQSSPHHLGAD